MNKTKQTKQFDVADKASLKRQMQKSNKSHKAVWSDSCPKNDTNVTNLEMKLNMSSETSYILYYTNEKRRNEKAAMNMVQHAGTCCTFPQFATLIGSVYYSPISVLTQ